MKSPHLSVEVIWEDEHMIKVAVYASNGSFSGISSFYDSGETYISLASELKKFSHSFKKSQESTFKQGDDLFSLSACFIDNRGHVSIDVHLNDVDDNDDAIINSVKLNAKTDLASIDRFCNDLELLGVNKTGVAKLVFIAT